MTPRQKEIVKLRIKVSDQSQSIVVSARDILSRMLDIMDEQEREIEDLRAVTTPDKDPSRRVTPCQRA